MTPLLAPARLGELLAPLFDGVPERERPAYARQLRTYAEPLLARHLALALLPAFAGYVQHTEAGRYLIGRMRPDDPSTAEHVTRTAFAEAVAEVLRALPDAPATATRNTRRAVEHVRLLAAHGPEVPYVRRIAGDIAERLPFVDDLEPRPAFVRSGAAAPEDAAKAREARLAYMREHVRAARAAERDGRRDDMMLAAAWASGWREQATPGAHKAGDVLAAYRDAAARSTREALGRNDFYKVADEVLGERTRRGKLGNVYVIPEEVPSMTRDERKQLAALVVAKLADDLRADLFAGLRDLAAEEAPTADSAPRPSPAVAGTAHVVDLASRRRARRVA